MLVLVLVLVLALVRYWHWNSRRCLYFVLGLVIGDCSCNSE